MATHEAPEEGIGLADGHPSLPATSETSNDSSPTGSQTLSYTTTGPAAAQPAVNSVDLASPKPSSQGKAEQQSSSKFAGSSPVKRKPVAPVPSGGSRRFSPRDQPSDEAPLPKPEHRYSRSLSTDSPTLYYFPEDNSGRPVGSDLAPASPDGKDNGDEPLPSSPEQELSLPADRAVSEARNTPSTSPAAAQTLHPSKHAGLTADVNAQANHDDLSPRPSESADNPNLNKSNNVMSLFVRKAVPPQLILANNDTHAQPGAAPTTSDRTDLLNKPLPKSPASSRLGSFFGWNNSSPSNSDPSDTSSLAFPSPFSTKSRSALADDSTAAARDSQATYAHALNGAAPQQPTTVLSTSATGAASKAPVQIEEMEDELKAISAELASSIRREMDLEDLVDRLQAEINNPQAAGKRTSDYFSDSGHSSAKFSDYDASKEEVAQVTRRAEQEQARIRLELTDKLQDERSKRLLLDRQIKDLAARASQVELAHVQTKDVSGRVKTLENTCEDLRRRLADERQAKGNFEELLGALKGELQNAANERDNLRDEVVPQLRARLEGLEAQATEFAKLTYDSTKLQQDMQTLKTENSNLRLGRGAQPPSSLGHSNSAGSSESREAIAERLKDVEAQRDALHSALKNLLERQEFQQRENEKRIKALEVERDRLMSASPGKSSYEKEIANLRQEVNMLRRRAEDAFEQKWQVEKGLTGLKMDLDRAEQEIADLRSLLRTTDVLAPSAAFARSSSGSGQGAVSVSSASLEKSYKDLQLAYAEALERIKSLELGGAALPKDTKTALAMKRLEESVSAAITERDLARQEISSQKSKVESFQTSEKNHLKSERELADQLRDSAQRVEDLAQQVRTQLAVNSTLRERLTQTVARGDAEQKANEDRILGMQGRLRTLEEQLVAAQSAAEDRVGRHEEEITALKEAHSTQLQRLRDAAASRANSPSRGLLTPTAPSGSPLASPLLRPSSRRSNAAGSALDGGGDRDNGEATAHVAALRARVTELEGALASADTEMQEVVGRMNKAQMEVMALQEEREQAIRETRKLQRTIEEEKVNAFEQRFRSITAMVR